MSAKHPDNTEAEIKNLWSAVNALSQVVAALTQQIAELNIIVGSRPPRNPDHVQR